MWVFPEKWHGTTLYDASTLRVQWAFALYGRKGLPNCRRRGIEALTTDTSMLRGVANLLRVHRLDR